MFVGHKDGREIYMSQKINASTICSSTTSGSERGVQMHAIRGSPAANLGKQIVCVGVADQTDGVVVPES